MTMRRCSQRTVSRWTVRVALACLLTAQLTGCNKAKKPEPKGKFEIHILASEKEDSEIIQASQKWFAEVATDRKRQGSLQKLAEQGMPPPIPDSENGPQYAWLEIGPLVRRSLHLDRDPSTEEPRAKGSNLDPPMVVAEDLEKEEQQREWNRIAEARDSGLPIKLNKTYFTNTISLWSRKCQSSKLAKELREQKKYDYFLLVRLTDPNAAVSGDQLTEVKIDRRNKAVQFSLDKIQFSLDKPGGDRLHQLTEKNKGRHMVVVLDGIIVFRAEITSPIRSKGQITGSFTDQELDQLTEDLGAEK